MKKIKFLGAAVLAASLIFAGCSSPAGAAPEINNPIDNNENNNETGQENNKKYDVGNPVCGQPVEDVRRYCFSADDPGKTYDDANGNGVQKYDENAVHQGLETACGRGAGAFQEERNRHRNHGEDAWSQNHSESPQYCLKN